MLTLENLVRDKRGRYILHGAGSQRVGRVDAERYLHALNTRPEQPVKPKQPQLLPCGAIVERRYTPWKTRVLCI